MKKTQSSPIYFTLTRPQSRKLYGLKSEQEAWSWIYEEATRNGRRVRLLARNPRTRFGELDLIYEIELIKNHWELVIAEVRSRSMAHPLVRAEESVLFKKQERLRRLSLWFLSRYRGEATSVRLVLLSRNSGRGPWVMLDLEG